MKIGDKLNMLTVIQDLGQVRYKTTSGFERNRHRVIVKCDCGKTKEVSLSEMICRNQQSCGCLKKPNIKHGLRGHPLYIVHEQMMKRCYKENNKSYSRYGGRGISVCEEWSNSFKAFYDWAVSHGYEYGLQIDRINNDGNYEPDNCRFVTAKENSLNRNNTIILTFNNKTQPLANWAEELGVNYNTMKWRYYCGYPIERILRCQ